MPGGTATFPDMPGLYDDARSRLQERLDDRVQGVAPRLATPPDLHAIVGDEEVRAHETSSKTVSPLSGEYDLPK